MILIPLATGTCQYTQLKMQNQPDIWSSKSEPRKQETNVPRTLFLQRYGASYFNPLVQSTPPLFFSSSAATGFVCSPAHTVLIGDAVETSCPNHDINSSVLFHLSCQLLWSGSTPPSIFFCCENGHVFSPSNIVHAHPYSYHAPLLWTQKYI